MVVAWTFTVRDGKLARVACLPTRPKPLKPLARRGRLDHPRIRRQLTAHPSCQRATHWHPIQRRLIDESLQALLIPILKPRGHRLDRLALAIKHQPAHIHLPPTALVLARHRAEHLRDKLDKPPARARKLALRQTNHSLHLDLLDDNNADK
jgi:hypothetical protein